MRVRLGSDRITLEFMDCSCNLKTWPELIGCLGLLAVLYLMVRTRSGD